MSPDRLLREATIRVLVADNSCMHTRLLADALRRDPVLEVIAFESDPSGVVAATVAEDVDVVVLSSNLDEQPARGFEVLNELRSLHRATRAVVLMASNDDETILKAFRAGARGLFSKHDPVEMLSECVRSVYQGKVWANNHALSIAVEALASAPSLRATNTNAIKLLSKRELEVVRRLAEGLTNREIAEQLNLSPHTIKNYLFRIFDKLGVSSRIELLFMTLSHAEEGPALVESYRGNPKALEYSHSESALLEKSAEAGFPAAQLALAQLHLFRRRDPQDLVDAYMWYLVATERALLARGLITRMLTPEQIEEAKHQASIRLSKLKRNAPSSLNLAPEVLLSRTG